MERIYREVLGIGVGDVVTTSWGTGPYEVWSVGAPYNAEPRLDGVLSVFAYPMVSLTVVNLGEVPRNEGDYAFINNIRRVADGWATPSGDRVLVEKPAKSPELPMDLFQSFPPLPVPFAPQEGVDYSVGPRGVWRCEACGRDFNAPPRGRYAPPFCPTEGCIGGVYGLELVGEDDWWCWATGKDSVLIDGKRYAKTA